MSIEQDLTQLALQEERLQFDHFDAVTAWEIGTRLKAAIEARGARAGIDIQLHGFPLFYYAMPGTTPDNGDWLRRKRNVVMRFHKSSYAYRLGLQKLGVTQTERFGIATADYAPNGGGFPIRVRGTGCVGSICVSGLPQRDDHGVIVEVVAAFLGIPLEGLALGPETTT